jgi:predicted RNA-binding Zn-ribbon protein involved in translation (DUF1610 family)
MNKYKTELLCHECGHFVGYVEDYAQFVGKIKCPSCGIVIIDSTIRAKSTKVKARGK